VQEGALEAFVNERPIEAENDRFIRSDPELRDHFAIINECFLALSELIRIHEHKKEDELVVLRLGVLVFNDAGAGLKCARAGYYQPAFAMVRDMVETNFLLDLFARDRTAIREWATARPDQRRRRFSPAAVREILDRQDEFTGRIRHKVYSGFSTYASHPDPEGFVLISPDNMTQIGLFPDVVRVRAFLQELARNFTNVILAFGRHIPHHRVPEILSVKHRFVLAMDAWARVYMPGTYPPFRNPSRDQRS
jgi:hypothetical protein